MTPPQIYVTILFVVFLVAASYFIYSGSSKPTSQTQDQTQTQTSSPQDQTPSEQPKPESIGKLVYGARTTSGVDIFTFDPQNNEKQKIFTDRDEEVKLKGASSLTGDSKNILAVMGDPGTEFIGNLYLISTDGKGTIKKILDNFASPTAPVISPSGDKVAAILFSNLDQNYGFTLYTMNLDGTSKVQIAKSADGISSPVWSEDTKFISYVNTTGQKVAIMKVPSLGGQEQTVYQTANENIYALGFSQGLYAFIKSPKGEDGLKLSEIYLLEEKGGEPKKITSNVSAENYPVFSKDNKKIAYIMTDPASSSLSEKTGKIHLTNPDGSDDKVVADANFIIGWIK